MKTLTAAISLAVLATGTAGAAVAYVSAAPQSSADQSVSAPAPAAPKPAPRAMATRHPARLEVRFRTCRAGARLEHGKCVRHVVRTVVVPAAPAPAVSTVSTPGPSGSSQHRPRKHRSGAGPRQGLQAAGAAHESESAVGHGAAQPPEPSDD